MNIEVTSTPGGGIMLAYDGLYVARENMIDALQELRDGLLAREYQEYEQR